MKKIRKLVNRVSIRSAKIAGAPLSLVLALTLVILWGICGPVYGYSDTWQLVINTSTTVITFLLAISIQYTQNRDSKALHLKLNELLRQTEEMQEALDKIEKDLEDEV